LLLNKITVFDKIIPDYYVYEENVSSLKWTIMEDSKKINGFTVQKATTWYGGRLFEAWFTEEIPINDGPYIFSGLPGLIIEVQDSKNHWKFSLVEMNEGMKNLSLEPRFVKKPIKTTKKKFISARQKFNQNAVSQLSASNYNIEDKEVINEVNNRFKKKNNFIELK